MPEVGDHATVTLTVDPHDGTTAVTLAVTAPDGVLSAPVVSTADGGGTWTAPLVYTLAGVWRLKWVVTGTGASVEGQKIPVAPAPDAPLGRSYATSTDLANYLGTAPPVDADRLLAEATTLLDSRVLRYCWYEVDDDGLPTDELVIPALARAVCAQARWWDELGGSTTGADLAGWGSVKIGSVQLGRSVTSVSGSDSPAQQIAPGVWDELNALNLTCDNFGLGAVTSC
ncbi:hypothetical protein [Streptomyces sp. NPDC060001]|uniref:hypothetical protein n=1 Tax=Streptomyces sp. NPDC060001 TaxID=3347032 RepID=UPI0036CACA0F